MNRNKNSSLCDPSIFANVYKMYATLVRNFIYYKYGDLENAADMTQNAFIKLWENCKKIPEDKAKAFLFTTANNLTLNTLKHQKVVLKYAESGIFKSVTHETPEYKIEEQEFRIKLEQAIADLTVKQREVFLLNRIEGMKYTEIALLLNISVKAVEKRMHGALLQLREKIGKI